MRTAFQFQIDYRITGNRAGNNQQQASQNQYQQIQQNSNGNRNQIPRSPLNNRQSLRNNFFEQNYGPNRNQRNLVECTFCNRKMSENELTAHWNSQCNMGRQRRNQNQNQHLFDEYGQHFQEQQEEENDEYLGLNTRFQFSRNNRNQNINSQIPLNRNNNSNNLNFNSSTNRRQSQQNNVNYNNNSNRNSISNLNNNNRQIGRNFSIRRINNNNNNNANLLVRSPQQQQISRQALLNNLLEDYRNYDLERHWDQDFHINSSDSDSNGSPERLLSPPRESLLQRQFRIRQQKMKEKQEKKKIVAKIYKTISITGEICKKLKKAEIDCAICLSGFEKLQTQAEMPCKHKFHKKCIDEWLVQKQECPLCKRKYK
ncbi:hypothetical protein PPERSA_04357 [Pseudocohnilembus persalinus]|uniref:RING-type domain-containing protein n=1 Tax=Pseudocohnilembus persalinus TaxID=266149 RepID=A0A0V0QQF9_PSEPJ|nr:hypothetical protein PPERSA_04357 [Pseudocohnilembus persalinus]|eukprot:KRX04542.1 hypothetical protein PPERSA_04357 [Pseudocohnilembus persalinus]